MEVGEEEHSNYIPIATPLRMTIKELNLRRGLHVMQQEHEGGLLCRDPVSAGHKGTLAAANARLLHVYKVHQRVLAAWSHCQNTQELEVKKKAYFS